MTQPPVISVRPVGADERAAWQPLWAGYLAFYKAMGYVDEAELPARLADNVRKMRGDEGFEGFD